MNLSQAPRLLRHRHLTAAMYQFVALPDCALLREPLQTLCDDNRVKGTLLLAPEGINGTISGFEPGVRTVLAYLRSPDFAQGALAGLQHKESWATRAPFLRMKVRVKKEIVTLGVPGVSPTIMAGTYVKPTDWNALISRGDVVLVDTRNDYEVDIGTFAGAVDPRVKTFADLPAWVAAQEQGGALDGTRGTPAAHTVKAGKKPAVAMFCTGGIRCEKSTAFLKMRGYDEVYHLEGGILKYLEEVPAEHSLWQGECFVFDERVSVGHGLKPGPYELCRSCRHPVGDVERASPQFVRGVSCPRCFSSRSDSDKAGLAERQRQVELAQVRGVAHVGAKMADKPARLADPLAQLLALLDAPPQHAGVRQRVVVALAGLPGSGKSTVAQQWAQAVNAQRGTNTALALGMDGFHLSRAQLATFADPQAALTRRGAPWTFDAAAFAHTLRAIRMPSTAPDTAQTWPGFEHGVGDPVAGAILVPPEVQLIIVEGLYLLHQGHGWNEGPDWAGLFDRAWYLNVPMKLAMQRLLGRHMASNGNSRAAAQQRLAANDRLNADIVLQSRIRAQALV